MPQLNEFSWLLEFFFLIFVLSFSFLMWNFFLFYFNFYASFSKLINFSHVYLL